MQPRRAPPTFRWPAEWDTAFEQQLFHRSRSSDRSLALERTDLSESSLKGSRQGIRSNVLHAGVLVGRDRADWWKEAAQRRLVERVEQFSDPTHSEIWIVFDRKEEQRGVATDVTSSNTHIRIIYATSADDWIVEQVQTFSKKHAITVVTADRSLQSRVRHAGGTLLSPLKFLNSCGQA